MSIPSRARSASLAFIVALQAIADLHDREQSPHRDVVAKRSWRALHRNRVAWIRHGFCHLAHVHASTPHSHVCGQKRPKLLVKSLWLDSDHIRKFMAHLVHDVM